MELRVITLSFSICLLFSLFPHTLHFTLWLFTPVFPPIHLSTHASVLSPLRFLLILILLSRDDVIGLVTGSKCTVIDYFIYNYIPLEFHFRISAWINPLLVNGKPSKGWKSV